MRFISHADPRVLIAWLRGQLAVQAREAPPGAAGVPAPVRVVVPNRRLAGELRRRLVEGGRAYLGLRVLDFGALAAEILDQMDGPEGEVRIAREVILGQLLHRCLEREGGALAAYARRRPGAVARLLAAFQEMREAEVGAGEADLLQGTVADPMLRELPRHYRRFLEALEQLERHGRTDRAGFASRAAMSVGGDQACPARPGPRARYYLYGAYEVIGVHLSLLRSVASQAQVTVLLPLDRRGPAWRHGREFAERFMLRPGESIEYLEDRCESRWAQAARFLYDEAGETAPAEEGGNPDLAAHFDLFHAQGPEAEITAVARRILDLAAGGASLSEIGVVGRDLEEYAPHLERVFGAHSIPFSTSARQPLTRFPAPAALLALLRLLEHDFEREDLLDFLRSPAVRWGEEARPRPDLLEVWSAEAGVRKGLRAWLEDVLDWQRELALRPRPEENAEAEAASRRERRLREIEEQRRILERVGKEAEEWKRCATQAARAGFLGALAARWLEGLDSGPSSDPASAALADVLEELREAALVDGERPEEQTLALLRGLVEGRALPMRDEDRGGVRVLDGMQARGHLFEHLFIVGLNAGRFPRLLAEDPFLSEEGRCRLRDERGRPLPLRRNDGEERQLLALWLASCSGRVCVSYQRAGEDGRALVASPALRELARLIGGRPRASDLAAAAALVPVHPGRRIEHWNERPRIVTPVEAALLGALGPGDREASVRRALAGRPEWSESLQCGLRSMARRRARWREEGRVGALAPGVLPERWSPSALERLARCPLRFCFERLLEVEPAPAPPEDGWFEPLDWGRRVHALLEDVFRTLGRDGLLEAAAGEAAAAVDASQAARCRDLVEGAWEEHFGDLGRRVSRRLPLLWEEAGADWRAALTAFVVREVEEWRRDGLERVELECEGEAELPPAPGGAPVPLRGRVDRVVLVPSSGRKRLGDYKSGRTLEGLGEPLRMLRGESLQAPLYAWIESARCGRGGPVDVEFLGVGPHHPPQEETSRLRVPHEDLERWRAGIEESVRVLTGQAAAGAFPFRHGNDCERCEYEAACHHGEREARSIVERVPEHAGYFALLAKTQKAPLLRASGAARRGAEEAEEE